LEVLIEASARDRPLLRTSTAKEPIVSTTELPGNVALITGASSGIGRATSLELARRGHRVACVDRQDPTETVAAITDAGGEALALVADVTATDQVAAAVKRATEAWGPVVIGVNCAGIVDDSPLPELGMDEWLRVISVNLTGTFVVSKTVLDQMPDGGRLVLLASIAGRTGGVKSGPSYAASKGGVLSFVKWAARFYAPRGITINAVAPGPIPTPMINSRGYSAAGIPVGRMGTPEEVAAGIAYLASAQAGYVTGTTLDINGGLYMN
jgi:3-oxoacyl-[acyl-carrier protein] reductase